MKPKLLLGLVLALSGGLFCCLMCAEGQTNDGSQPSKADIQRLQLEADIGNVKAQSQLGMAYLGGDGVPKDAARSVYWFKKAAEQGDAVAQGGLGTLYLNGEGVAEDKNEAFKWLKKAADQGLFVAQDQLGVLYGNGWGVDKNLVEAYKWFSLAAQQGYQTAIEHRATIMPFLTRDQITEGDQRARAFVPVAEGQTVHSDSNSTNAAVKPKTPEELQTEVQAGYDKFIPMATNRVGTNYAAVVAKALSQFETNALNAVTNTTMKEMAAAASYLTDQKKEGRLPGVLKDSHALVQTELLAGNFNLSELNEAKYPFSLTFNVVLEGDSLTNHYTVVRPAKDAQWQLEKAWRTDTDGHTIKDWPAK